MELGGKALLRLLEQRLDGPILYRVERLDLTLALHDESQRNRLHASRRDPLLDRLPEYGTRLITHEPVQDPASLLSFDLLLINHAGLLDGTLHRVLRDLVKEHAADGNWCGSLLGPDLERHVRRNRLALAVRIGGDQHFA